jgi:hypothetical protein
MQIQDNGQDNVEHCYILKIRFFPKIGFFNQDHLDHYKILPIR